MPMLRQIEWGLQNVSITKSGFLQLTTLLFKKNNLSIRTSSK